MKTIRKLCIAFLSLFSVLCSTVTPAFAEEAAFESVKTGYYISYDEEGNVLDGNMPIQTLSTHTTTTVVNSGTVYEEDCGYHPNTSYWRKVDSYTLSESSTVSVSVSASGYSGTIGVSVVNGTSFSYTKYADSSRYSKLRVYVSYTWKRYLAKEYDNYSGTLVRTFYFVTTQKTAEDLRVVYQ